MISLNTSITETHNIRGLLEEKIQHEYLEKYLKKPKIDEEKLSLLTALVDHKDSLDEIQKKRYIITTMLVQIALDTHELVPAQNNSNESKEEKLSKQLKVLAGDYYSGLYYFLLSEIEDIEFIHTLAAAIKEINEYKISLYYKELDNLEDFFEATKKLDAMLLLHVAEFIYDSSLNQLISDWLFTDRVIQEKIEAEKSGHFPLQKKWQAYDETSTNTFFINKVNALIRNNKTEISRSCSTLPEKYSFFKSYIHDRLQDTECNNSSMVEEG